MKKFILFALLLPTVLHLQAQTTAKRYVFLEHFTNSRCSVCASRNPAFYNLINQYPNDVHHLSVHPPVPYNNCVFYLANPSENSARAAIYGINGTPRVALNGQLMPAGTSLLKPDSLINHLDDTSPIHVRVTETGAGPDRMATIIVTSLSDVPAGNYRLFAAVAEKTINMVTPNNEAVHHNVFRQMLPVIDGMFFTPGSAGQTVTVTLPYSINASWNADEIYVLAFVQNVTTKEVLNSGTRFDPVLTGTEAAATAQPLRLQPNPAADQATAYLGDVAVEQVDVFDLSGRRVSVSYEAAAGSVTVRLGALAPGVYLVRVTGKNEVFVGKVVRP